MNVPERSTSQATKAAGPPWLRSRDSSWCQRLGRRTVLAMLTGGFLAAPLAVQAQPRKIYRIGLLFGQLPPTFPGEWPFYERMRELGWMNGREFVTEYRLYGDRYERVPDLANELIRTGVDIFLVGGAADALRVQQVTRTIPIVTYAAGDLVVMGLAASLANPGGNVTGIQTLQPQLVGKLLSLLREVIPHFSRAGIFFHTSYPSKRLGPSDAAALAEAKAAAKHLSATLQVVVVQDADKIESAFSTFRARQAQGVVLVRDTFMGLHMNTLADLALKHRLPTISDLPTFAVNGGLISYGYNFDDTLRSAADIVDKILRGAKAGEVPIQQAATFRLVINKRTAQTIGVTLPVTLLLQANHVID